MGLLAFALMCGAIHAGYCVDKDGYVYGDTDVWAQQMRTTCESVKANLTSTTYLMGQGDVDSQAYQKAVFEPYQTAYGLGKLYGEMLIEARANNSKLKPNRLQVIDALLDLFDFAAKMADGFYKPVGLSKDCRFYPASEVLQFQVAPPLSGILRPFSKNLQLVREAVSSDRLAASNEQLDEIKNLCSAVDIGDIHKNLKAFVGPECDQAGPIEPVDNFREDARKGLAEYARETGFEGGDENRCLQIFVARYTRSTEAAVMFRNAVDKYAYIAINIQGFCAYVADDYLSYVDDHRDKTEKVVMALRQGMEKLDKVSLNSSVKWNCDGDQPSVTKGSTAITDQSSVTTSNSGDHTEPPPAPTVTDKFGHVVTDEAGEPVTLTTTTVPPTVPTQKQITPTMVEAAVDRLIEKAHGETSLSTQAWYQRIPRYRSLIQDAVRILKQDHASTMSLTRGSIEGVMYLPYVEHDREQHCYDSQGSNGGSAHRYSDKGANYYVKYTYYPVDHVTLNGTMERLKQKKKAILDSVFSAGGGNLCDKVTEALKGHEAYGAGGFTGYAAVKCGRKFVWYQLGYNYFGAVGASDSNYVLDSDNLNSYNSNCGQLVFLP